MGIPSYFRNITKTNPSIIKNKIKQEVSHLYLDLNCAIHKCCREVMDKQEEISKNELEEKMIQRIIDYIIELYNYVKPQDVLYIAIDGVAPRAKMVQQRLRRFKSVKEKKLKQEIEKKYNNEMNNIWDTNAITPGTTFMTKLAMRIRKILTNKNCLNCSDKFSIILSDSNVPGEGEHKIYNYIKNLENTNNTYNAVESCHIVYGLDADLIMLSLTCHLDNIYLLREELEFNIEDKSLYPFLYLDINDLSNCIVNYLIDNEMKISIQNKWKIIDDYVTICFLMGNDFLPHIPSLDIRNNGLNILLDNYIKVYNKLEEHLLIDHSLNLEFLKELLSHLLTDENRRLNYATKKLNNLYWNPNSDLNDKEKELDKLFNYPLFNRKLENIVVLGDKDWRIKYYKYILKIDLDEINKVYMNYYEGIIWTLNYYFDNCVCYDWHYKYNHGPTLYDIYNNLEQINNVSFLKRTCYTPFEQLLMVLPPYSNNLLPINYQKLQTSKDSPIIEYYPIDFEIETYYKRYFWECEAILPKIDINKISQSIKNLSIIGEEKDRNSELKDAILS